MENWSKFSNKIKTFVEHLIAKKCFASFKPRTDSDLSEAGLKKSKISFSEQIKLPAKFVALTNPNQQYN